MAFSTRTVVLIIMAFAIAPSLQTSIPVSTVESYSTVYSEVTPTLPASTSGTQIGCPTVTLTSSICSTCITPACVEIEALTQSCECPGAIPTVFADFPCNGDNACAGIGCAANYVFFTASCVASTSTATGSGSGSGSANTTTSSVSSTGAGGVSGANSTATGVNGTAVTASITSTASRTSGPSSAAGSGTSLASTASVAMAGVLRPFWMGWM